MSSDFDALDKSIKGTVAFMARNAYAEQTGIDKHLVDVIAVSGASKQRDELHALQEQFATDPAKLAEAEALAARDCSFATITRRDPGRGRA